MGLLAGRGSGLHCVAQAGWKSCLYHCMVPVGICQSQIGGGPPSGVVEKKKPLRMLCIRPENLHRNATGILLRGAQFVNQLFNSQYAGCRHLLQAGYLGAVSL